MNDILAQNNIHTLFRFAARRVLVALDYDGTLAPIVDDPETAHMRPRTRELLARVCRLYPCIIVSGRAQEDVAKRVRGVGVREVIGNHGLEPWRRSEGFSEEVGRWVEVLRDRLSGLEGVVVEDKVFSVAVHYRKAPDTNAARAAILEAAARLDPQRIMGGKMVVNLLPDGAPLKGLAVQAARDRLACEAAIYVGDDETDEDVFALDETRHLLGIMVGSAATSCASFCVSGQEEVDALLQALVSFRTDQQASA